MNYLILSKQLLEQADGPDDEGFDGEFTKEDNQKIQDDLFLANTLFNRFEERGFYSVAEFFEAVPEIDLSYLKGAPSMTNFEDVYQQSSSL